MTGRHKKTVIVITALARELCGFVWAIACQISAPEKLKQRENPTVQETEATAQKEPAQLTSASAAANAKREYPLGAPKKFKK